MKHCKNITISTPKSADVWQEVVCNINHVVYGIVTAKGGSAPINAYIDEKCDIPPRNGSSTSSTSS